MTVEVRTHERPPIWRNVAVLKWTAQIFALLVLISLAAVLIGQASANFSASQISFGWSWLADPPLIQLREGIDVNPDSGARAIVAGIVNTLRVAASGIVAATIIGTLIGIARLSRNWIVNKLATLYIETIRNIPLLIQIFFWQALVIGLPPLTDNDVGSKIVHFSNKGLATTWAFPSTGFWPWLLFVAGGLVAAHFVSKRRTRLMEETGVRAFALTYGFLTVLAFAIVGWFAHPLLTFLEPLFDGLATFVRNLPAVAVPLVIAVASLGGAAWWIRSFFEARRTPAGFGKLTDDDVFRVVFAAVAGVALAVAAFVVGGFEVTTPEQVVKTLSELIRDGSANIMNWFADKFTGSTGGPLDVQQPAVIARGGRFVQYAIESDSGSAAGLIITPPFFSVWVGVTLYTAAFIAEIVRGGILAVSKGQTEAAQAVGLKRSQLLRLIVLPQAFRIILPPMGNQYLNLFKNTSLGIAVAFSDIVQVGQTIYNQTGQSLPVVLIWMAFFLTGSLSISAVVNFYNRRLALVER
ncbi:MAG: ABC transporter permease subunit [Acidimicrobiia bacterium]